MSEPASAATLDTEVLRALLGTLLPGNEHWPGATELDLASTVVERAPMAEGHAEAIERLLEQLPTSFVDASVDEREAALRALEGSEDFGTTLLVAYDAYYVHERVLGLLEERCGYVTRPPQPEGFELEPFDESCLDNVRKREPFWRRA